jgi:hypothetical protein
MSDVHVNRFQSRYRLPPAAFAERRRLDQIRTQVLDKAFSRVLAENGIGANAELCIRSVIAEVHLRLDRSDESVTDAWSEAIAAEISHALRGAGADNVTIYHSRGQALFDFAVGIARGDWRRAWAWRQLGLWRSREMRDEAQAVVELVTALCAEADLLVPTLRALAEDGWLHRLAARVSEAQWIELASAVLSRTRASDLIGETKESPSPRAVRKAMHVLNRSKLACAISATRSLEAAGLAARRAVAVLAVMEVEPTLLFTPTAANLIAIIATAIQSPENETVSFDHDLVADVEDEKKRHDGESGQSLSAETRTVTIESDGDPSGIATGLMVHELDQQLQTGPAPEPSDLSRQKVNDGKTPSLPIDLRRRALTGAGGLLFLVHVVNALGLPEEIAGHEVLGARPFFWVMHQLALTLRALPPTDPAALAFAGLSPETIPPSEEETPASELETAALAGMAGRIVEHLRWLLELEDDSAEMLLEFVCDRRAEVVTDPGWIELRFSLDEVSTEIRRAGLDLDPGYVPWLGVVMRFIYE